MGIVQVTLKGRWIMEPRTVAAVAVVVAVVLVGVLAPTPLMVIGSCDGSCCFGLHRGDDPGTCKECGKQTPVESHALCTACAERGGRCTHCMKTIHREQ